VRQAEYPPAQSNYNAIERWWGHLESHSPGARRDARATRRRFAATMTGKGIRPIVELVTSTDSPCPRIR
jgi:hypothetical protein